MTKNAYAGMTKKEDRNDRGRTQDDTASLKLRSAGTLGREIKNLSFHGWTVETRSFGLYLPGSWGQAPG